MSRHRLAVRLSIAVLVGLSILAADVASARASMLAAACCAKMNGDCAGLKSPDDCCRGMGHATAGPTTTTPPGKSALDSPVLLAVSALSITSFDSSSTAVVAVAFKRPHDPPHLHTFALLI